MLTQKLQNVVLAAATLALVAGSAQAVPENGLGGLTCCVEDAQAPYDVLDQFADDAGDGWYREAPSDGDPEVVSGSAAGGTSDDERPTLTNEG